MTIGSLLLIPKCCICVHSSFKQNWCDNERKRKGKGIAKFCVLTRINPNPGLNFSQQHDTFTQKLRWTVPSTVWTVDTVISETPSF